MPFSAKKASNGLQIYKNTKNPFVLRIVYNHFHTLTTRETSRLTKKLLFSQLITHVTLCYNACNTLL